VNKIFVVNLLSFVLVLSSSCKKDDGTTGPPPDPEFPASSNFAVTLYTPKTTLSVNESFEVKAILYNVTDVFGAALEIKYSPDKVQIVGIDAGTSFFPGGNVLTISMTEPDSLRASYGATLKAGISSGISGSGVLAKFRCKALAAGTPSFLINESKLALKKSDGNPITGFSTIQKNDLLLTIQ
jgi:hypothetical protein